MWGKRSNNKNVKHGLKMPGQSTVLDAHPCCLAGYFTSTPMCRDSEVSHFLELANMFLSAE